MISEDVDVEGAVPAMTDDAHERRTNRRAAMARSGSGESVIERVVRVLDAFTPDARVLTLGQVARRAGLPQATASRLVADLVAQGLLVRDDDRGLRIGTRLWELGSRASFTTTLRQLAMPALEALLGHAGHHAQLGVLDGDEVLFLERLSADGAVVNYTRIAARLPLHASSSGLVLLAHGPPELQDRVLDRPLPGFTATTPTDPAALRRRLADVRRDGFVLCPGYLHREATGLAVPVRDEHGGVVAAVSVIVPNDDAAHGNLAALVGAAREIEGRLAASTGHRDGR